ncbi:MAG: hypothetical protein RIN56_03275 [Sporomusaceae bacterium]|nr:hypothetical protein [Sporomusaceae bacterium]
MNKLLKTALACLLAVFLLTGTVAAVAQQALFGVSSPTIIAAEEEKKPEPPANKPAEEDDGGCKC